MKYEVIDIKIAHSVQATLLPSMHMRIIQRCMESVKDR